MDDFEFVDDELSTEKSAVLFSDLNESRIRDFCSARVGSVGSAVAIVEVVAIEAVWFSLAIVEIAFEIVDRIPLDEIVLLGSEISTWVVLAIS